MRASIFLAVFVALLAACNSKLVSVSGTICFPSEYVPKMNVYLKEYKTNKTYKVTTSDNQQEFKFNHIPLGNYYVYAYTVEELGTDSNGKKTKSSGGFTQAVPCGLTIKCNDHSLIPIKLKSRLPQGIIKICDWYGATLPPEN